MFIFHKKKASWKNKVGGILFIFLIFPMMSYAGISIVELLPNPAGDDTLGEYIEIRNTGCNSMDIGGYHIFDASKKTYVFQSSTVIASHENIRLPYSTTKIALNNTGIESVTITDSGGTILDTYTYSGTQQDDIVILISSTDEDCSIVIPVDTHTYDNTGIVDSGTLNTGSLTLDNTGIIIVPPENNTGSTESGNIVIAIVSTGSNYQSGIELSLSGTIDIVSTNTGITLESGSVFSELPTSTGTVIGIGVSNTGIYTSGAITDSGIIFPDIFPTIQYPTNALFSGGIFDCTDKLPCRINITFDPIFTGSILARDYICEVITDSGSMNTCNPNTLYFLTGSLFSLRIINKIDTSQSVTRSWGVIYSNILTSTINSGSVSGSEIDNPISNILDSGATDSGVLFPDIIPVFQNYTNTVNSGDILTCTTSPCRVNFTLDPIFTGSYLAKNYNCQIIYGTGIYDTCNPAQLYLIGTGSIDIIVTHKNSGQKSYRSLQIIQNIIPQNNSTNKITKNEFVIDTSPPIAVLEFDGKLKSYHDQIGEYEMNCYTSTCTINLSAEKSYDPEGGKLHFLWYYGLNDIKITRNPGERKYGLGDHQIWLRVIDESGNVTSIRYYIHVLGEREKLKNEKIEKKTKIKDNTKKVPEKTKKSKKPKKITFFDPPKIVLQKSKFIEQENGYMCYTNTKNCSLNLTLSGSQKGIIYTWIYDNGDMLVSKNPKSKSLSPGVHIIRLIAGYSSDMPIWNRDIRVTVIKVKKAKKIKKPKKPKIVHISGSVSKNNTMKNQIIGENNEEKSDTTIPYTAMALIGGIMPIIVLRRLLIGVIWKI